MLREQLGQAKGEVRDYGHLYERVHSVVDALMKRRRQKLELWLSHSST